MQCLVNGLLGGYCSHFSAEVFISAVKVVKGSPGPNGETFGGRLMMKIVTDR